MKLLFISTETRPAIGGVASAVDCWGAGLCTIGHEVKVLGLHAGTEYPSAINLKRRKYVEESFQFPQRDWNVFDRFMPLRKARSLQFLVRRDRAINDAVGGILSQFRPDRVIFAVVNSVCCTSLPLVRARGIATVGIAHGSEVQPARVENPGWLRKTLQQFETIIANSRFTRSLVAQWGVSSDRISVVHPGITDDLVSSEPNPSEPVESSSEQPLRLVSICRLVERKGIQVVLEAIAELRVLGIRVYYDIVGEGPYRSVLEQLIKSWNLEDTVTLHGPVNDEKRNILLQESDLFVMVPFEDAGGDVEGFGIAYLEAGVFGKAVIASRSGGIEDAVAANVSGLLVEPHDAHAVADAIQTLIKNKHLRRTLGQRGRDRAKDFFPEACGRRFEQALGVDTASTEDRTADNENDDVPQRSIKTGV